MPVGSSEDSEPKASMSAYTSALHWCLTCDVGWRPRSQYAVDACWLCESPANVWTWTWVNAEPGFVQVSDE